MPFIHLSPYSPSTNPTLLGPLLAVAAPAVSLFTMATVSAPTSPYSPTPMVARRHHDQVIGYIWPSRDAGYRRFIKELQDHAKHLGPKCKVIYDTAAHCAPGLTFGVRFTTGTLYTSKTDVLDRVTKYIVNINPFDSGQWYPVSIILDFLKHVSDNPDPTPPQLRKERGTWEETARQWVRDAKCAGRLYEFNLTWVPFREFLGSDEAVVAFHEGERSRSKNGEAYLAALGVE